MSLSSEKLDTNLRRFQVVKLKIPLSVEAGEFLLNIELGSPRRRLTSVFDLE